VGGAAGTRCSGCEARWHPAGCVSLAIRPRRSFGYASGRLARLPCQRAPSRFSLSSQRAPAARPRHGAQGHDRQGRHDDRVDRRARQEARGDRRAPSSRSASRSRDHSDYDREKLQERLAKCARAAWQGVYCERGSGPRAGVLGVRTLPTYRSGYVSGPHPYVRPPWEPPRALGYDACQQLGRRRRGADQDRRGTETEMKEKRRASRTLCTRPRRRWKRDRSPAAGVALPAGDGRRREAPQGEQGRRPHGHPDRGAPLEEPTRQIIHNTGLDEAAVIVRDIRKKAGTSASTPRPARWRTWSRRASSTRQGHEDRTGQTPIDRRPDAHPPRRWSRDPGGEVFGSGDAGRRRRHGGHVLTPERRRREGVIPSLSAARAKDPHAPGARSKTWSVASWPVARRSKEEAGKEQGRPRGPASSSQPPVCGRTGRVERVRDLDAPAAW